MQLYSDIINYHQSIKHYSYVEHVKHRVTKSVFIADTENAPIVDAFMYCDVDYYE